MNNTKNSTYKVNTDSSPTVTRRYKDNVFCMLYSDKRHFITFYNGKEKMKERVKILRLSDMFEQKTDNPELELIVTVININPEDESDNDGGTAEKVPIIVGEYKYAFVKNALANADILNRCKSLRDYMTFVNKVRNKTDVYEMDVKEAVTEAVDECIKEDVLSEFFIEHREEVIAVSVFEYDEEGHMDIVREEGREEERLNIMKNVMNNLGKSADEAMDIIGVKEAEREELKKMLLRE